VNNYQIVTAIQVKQKMANGEAFAGGGGPGGPGRQHEARISREEEAAAVVVLVAVERDLACMLALTRLVCSLQHD
jgi:hypothetical protein